MLASGSEFVDWRHWLLFASLPWVYPTQTQLLDLLNRYKLEDRLSTGLISKNTFLKIPLWFKIEKPQTPPDPMKPHSFDRHMHLINFWFDLFSVAMPSLPNLTGQTKTEIDDNQLDYKTMVCLISFFSRTLILNNIF
jgi:hypothetical protein